jgi:hypothetical protein
MNESRWTLSTESAHYHGNFSTKEQAISEGIRQGHSVFWVGLAEPPKPLSEGFYARDIIEKAQDWLEEDWHLEESAGWEPTQSDYDDLQQKLKQAIDAWTQERGLTPYWFVVRNPERIERDKLPQ